MALPRRALVLTAGLGTRLRPLTLARAKAAAPVDGEALVRRTIAWLVAQGVTDLVLNLHHRPQSIAAEVGDGADLGARVRYSWECPILGSAGGPRHALPLLMDDSEDRTFVLVNGDTLTDLRLDAMAAQHRASGALVTMAVIPNPRPDKYGGVLLDENLAVTGFSARRAPGTSSAPSPSEGFHFIGPQIVDAAAFEALPDGVPAESVVGIYPRMIAERPGSVMGFKCEASFQDIGTPADLLRTSLDLAAAAGRPGAPRQGRGVRIAPTARVTRSVLWDAVTIGDRAIVEECVLADGVAIPADGVYRRCAAAMDGNEMIVTSL